MRRRGIRPGQAGISKRASKENGKQTECAQIQLLRHRHISVTHRHDTRAITRLPRSQRHPRRARPTPSGFVRLSPRGPRQSACLSTTQQVYFQQSHISSEIHVTVRWRVELELVEHRPLHKHSKYHPSGMFGTNIGGNYGTLSRRQYPLCTRLPYGMHDPSLP